MTPYPDYSDTHGAGCPVEAAMMGLYAIMSGISEECWCAGWLNGNEAALWPPRAMRYGQGEVTERQAMLLRLLSEEAGGWWGWNDDGPVFMSMPEWLIKVESSHAP